MTYRPTNDLRRVVEDAIALVKSSVQEVMTQARAPMANLLDIQWDPEARAAFEYFVALGKLPDEGSQRLAALFEDLTIPELLLIMPRLAPLPRKRGRPTGSGTIGEQHDRARAALIARNGTEPNLSEISREIVATSAPRTKVESVRRHLNRRGMTKNR